MTSRWKIAVALNNTCINDLSLLISCFDYIRDLDNYEIAVVTNKSERVLSLLKEFPIDEIFLLDYEKLARENIIFEFETFVRSYRPDIILIGDSPFEKRIVANIVKKFDIGVIADAIKYTIENGVLRCERATFDGNCLAFVESRSIIQLGIIKGFYYHQKVNKIETTKNKKISVHNMGIKSNAVTENTILYRRKGEIRVCKKECGGIVVGVGNGCKKNFDEIKRIALWFGAKVYVTRPLVNEGYADEDILIGQSGMIIKPKLYIALGISGAIQHMVGVLEAECIIAVNTDSEAPIFHYSNYGIVGNGIQVLREVANYFEKHKNAKR